MGYLKEKILDVLLKKEYVMIDYWTQVFNLICFIMDIAYWNFYVPFVSPFLRIIIYLWNSCFSVNIYFINEDGEKMEAKANVGDNLLDVVIENDIDIDGFGK